jgi:glycosyltransferase involved in cell wall biosynthesis
MRKLIIQIPCFNESGQIESTIKNLPKSIQGFEAVEILVIDDGSTDNSHEIALKSGATKVICLKKHQGLAKVFSTGLRTSIEMNADVIVNYDADAQFPPEQIQKLVNPIINGSADMVIGCRDMKNIGHYGLIKKLLQRFGSWAVRRFSGTDIPDTTSGFRAYSKDAAIKINILSQYTYTLETIIQAGRIGLSIAAVPVDVRPSPRKSRLISSNWNYVARSAGTILRVYMMYSPLKTFGVLGGVFFAGGLFLDLRYLFLYFLYGQKGHLQSLILSAILILIGFMIWVLGLLADLVSANRLLLEETLVNIKKSKSN